MNESELAAKLCLLTMPGMGPARLRWLTQTGPAGVVVDAIRRGGLPSGCESAPVGVSRDLVALWERHARATNGEELLENHRAFGLEVLAPGDRLWPFGEDPEPPALLFAKGDIELLSRKPTVGVVGTRRCTSVGRRIATKLGMDLAEAGVVVVSGLALGIDGCSHRGALSIGDGGDSVIGVVATGLDVVYPAAHAELWEEVSGRGLLLSEAPLGVRAQKWRFPARNRLLAGLSSVIVVVESHERGGALSTVDEAVRRSVEVQAVPGSVLSAASAGTNALLYEGATPVRSAQDVLSFLGLHHDLAVPNTSDSSPQYPGAPPSTRGLAGSRSKLEALILEEISSGGIHLDVLITTSGEPLREVVQALRNLDNDRLVELDGSVVTLAEKHSE